jgi:hypothetical protein
VTLWVFGSPYQILSVEGEDMIGRTKERGARIPGGDDVRENEMTSDQMALKRGDSICVQCMGRWQRVWRQVVTR